MINRASSDNQLIAYVTIAEPQKMEAKSWVSHQLTHFINYQTIVDHVIAFCTFGALRTAY